MPKKLLNYKGAYGDQNNPVPGALINYEPLKERSELYDYEITEHLHTDLIQLFFITKGGGILLSEGKKIALNTPCVLIIPNSTLHGFVFQSDISGEVLSISVSFFEKSLEKDKKVLLQLNKLQQLTFEEKAPLLKKIKEFTNHIITELSTNKPEKNIVIQLFFHLLLLHLYRTIKDKPTVVIPTENRMLNYYHTFQKLIQKHIHETKPIKEYAKELNISPVHLNRICQTLVQKSALQVVHEYLLAEAKKYLLGTDYSIAEISYFLDFNDPSHFSKFFKKMVGVTPRKFRIGKRE